MTGRNASNRSADGPNAGFVAVAARVEHQQVLALAHCRSRRPLVSATTVRRELLDRRDPAQALLDRAGIASGSFASRAR